MNKLFHFQLANAECQLRMTIRRNERYEIVPSYLHNFAESALVFAKLICLRSTPSPTREEPKPLEVL